MGGPFQAQVSFSALRRLKDAKDKKPKPVREESFSSKEFFEHNDFSFIDRMVDPDRERWVGAKGHPPSSISRAILLMYLLSMGSILELIRFLRKHEWLAILDLRRRVDDAMQYRIPRGRPSPSSQRGSGRRRS